MFIISDSGGKMADYMVLNDSMKRVRPVSRDFKQYQFFENETKPNAMKSRFKTKKILTAVKKNRPYHNHVRRENNTKNSLKTDKISVLEKAREQRKPTSRSR